MTTIILAGPDAKASPSTPEAAAEGYFHNRVTFGVFTPKPPVEKWLPDQRARFEKELKRLETERDKQRADAAKLSQR